jgi:hypothetical protein
MAESVTLQDVMDLIGDMNTVVVGDYFESRGFETEKLDTGEGSSPPSDCDWLAQTKEVSFLCEVKTINSVQRGTNTQAEFRSKFENRVRDYFSRKKSVQDLPYHLHFDSDALTIPDDSLLNSCLKSIPQLLLDIHAQEKKQPFWLFCDYCEGAFDLVVTWSRSGKLEVQVSPYGALNLRAIEDGLGRAIKQLRRSGEDYPGIARVVVLAFVSSIYITRASEVVAFGGLQFKRENLWRRIDSVLKRNGDLSAIAVMYGQAPPRFGVYHNRTLTEVEPLDRGVFDDGVSAQFDSFDTIPKATAKPFDLREFTASVLETARSEGQRAITLADYEALKRQKTRQE